MSQRRRLSLLLPLNSNLILLILTEEKISPSFIKALNSNLILLILQWDCCFFHHLISFKFQSDSINTEYAEKLKNIDRTLNSNLILLIPLVGI